LDDADRAQSDRPGRRLSSRQAILDSRRDTEIPDAFGSVLIRDGIHVVRLPPKSPNLNAFAERFVRSIKEECLSRMIFFGQASLSTRDPAVHDALPH